METSIDKFFGLVQFNVGQAESCKKRLLPSNQLLPQKCSESGRIFVATQRGIYLPLFDRTDLALNIRSPHNLRCPQGSLRL
jgi:hypothetical protein